MFEFARMTRNTSLKGQARDGPELPAQQARALVTSHEAVSLGGDVDFLPAGFGQSGPPAPAVKPFPPPRFRVHGARPSPPRYFLPPGSRTPLSRQKSKGLALF